MAQDDITLRTALNARPRAEREFVSGDYVCYWRTQKYQRGVRLVGGRWFGTAVVMGRLGRNLLIYHRKNMFKVAPEHLRHASSEEKLASQIDSGELKGISELIEKEGLLGHQFVDLTSQPVPPSADAAGQLHSRRTFGLEEEINSVESIDVCVPPSSCPNLMIRWCPILT